MERGFIIQAVLIVLNKQSLMKVKSSDNVIWLVDLYFRIFLVIQRISTVLASNGALVDDILVRLWRIM